MIRTFSIMLLIFSTGFFLASWKTNIKTDQPEPLTTLSEYGFFTGKMNELQPAEDILPYDLNTPLFSDYAYKARFVKIPKGEKAVYMPDKVFEFPVGTVLIKNFFYYNDERKPAKGRKIIETRLLIRESAGWSALPYIWNEEQTEAYLELAGGSMPVSWTQKNGKKKELEYFVPNMNQCKGCHSYNISAASVVEEGMPVSGEMVPIGPAARHLNKNYDYATGTENQLAYWVKKDILTGLPAMTDIPRLPQADNALESNSLDARARAYLDINCGHCHYPYGPANTSGMFLHFAETDPAKWGVLKSPVSAGKGSGGRLFGIVPGKPDESILLYRMESTDPGEQMPEIGRHLVHEEGVKLIRDWILSMR